MPPHHPRSPSPNLLQNHINSPRIKDSFPHSSQIMYNNSHFTSEFSQSDSDLRKQHGKNGFPSYHSAPFNPYNRHPQSSSNYASPYPQDSYTPQPDSHLSQGRFDIGTSQAFDDSKQSYVGIDQYGNTEAGSLLLNNQPNLSPNPQSQTSYSQVPYLTGLTHVQSQTPYGPHVSGPLNQTPVNSSSAMHSTNGTGQNGPQPEEISTIFVVGFPDDMQEREFQNMFSFSSGFEAATLKIPNKEFTSYGSNANGIARYPSSYNGSNDPYNLVTVNQGGVVVDNGRDGTTSSWPTSSDEAHYLSSTVPQPARKQIIGFAKFRTRQEALEARDILQGRRVDVEKGAVLKAEMAKKNLHTKRGPAAAPPGLTSIVGAGISAGESGSALNGIQNEPMSTREREIVTLGAMGLASRRERVPDQRDPDEDRDRRTAATRGARERAEEDERERDRKRQEKDAARLRSATFDAFHSVPPPRLVSQNSFPLPSGNSVAQSSAQDGFGSSVWGMTTKESTARKFAPIGVSDVSSRAPSPQNDLSHAPSLGSSRSVASEDSSGHLSPTSNALSLPPHPSLPLRPRPLSPTLLQYSSMPSSSASSADGFGSETEPTNQASGLTIGTEESTSPQSLSPNSPPGGANAPAASARGNPGDQNPPINTLYVGNLPSSPPPGNYLEDELRELFGRRPGYRKLCFRQKNNGPMCFVEFEDVRHATKALNDLHGNTLNGLVKSGGIRLSYSKNPLGVRTPTSATGAASQHQQFKDSMHSAPPSSGFFPPESFNRESSQSHRPTVALARRDMTSQQQSYQYTTSPPAPRFSSPTSTHYPASTTLPTFPRSVQSQYGVDTMNTSSTFSPFRISSTSPRLDQFGADMNERFGHILSPPPVNGIETSRAG